MAEDVCPVWVAYLLASPLRKLLQNPERILAPCVHESMTVVDIGCAMGFFSLPLARLVGSRGRVVCLDMQAKMLSGLEKRTARAGLADRVEARLCRQNSLDIPDLADRVDFVLAYAVVHEVPNAADLFAEIHQCLKPRARLLFAEPSGHISADKFHISLDLALNCGFRVCDEPKIKRSHSVLLQKS